MVNEGIGLLMDKMIKGFLETEIQYQDFYYGIIDFITNDNIRNGEYECNEYVIKKMDHNCSVTICLNVLFVKLFT